MLSKKWNGVYVEIGYRFKAKLAEVIIEYTKPIKQRLSDYLSDPVYVLDVLKNSRESLCERAEATTREVKEKLGLNLSVDVAAKLKANI